MASRFLTRSKALALAASRAHAAAPSPLAASPWLRTLSSLPRDPAVPSPRQPPAAGSPLGLSKILGYEQASRFSGTQVLPCWFSTGASNGFSVQQTSQTSPKTIAGMVQSDALKTQEGVPAKVTAFSPLKATIAKHRSSPSTSESLKVRLSKLLTKVTFYMIPILSAVPKNSITASLFVMSVFHQAYMLYKENVLDCGLHDITKHRRSPLTSECLKVTRSEHLTQLTLCAIPTLLLVSKNIICTSLVVMSVFHQVYMFHKEIFLDYVHHDITRKWALIYLKLLLLIMAKDTMVYFDLF